ncbi:hypothetical protein ACQ856_29625 (plasmid) [Mycolicibacterium psychrotolerans]|uniref:hypothetical protein n=1 Tax=Mycolicibacterium psychrotolerans TaxID=216929 RepID=UPI003D66D5E4
MVEIAHQAAQASATRLRNLLGRIVNDIEALSDHWFTVFSANAELHDRVRCGLSPDDQFLQRHVRGSERERQPGSSLMTFSPASLVRKLLELDDQANATSNPRS